MLSLTPLYNHLHSCRAAITEQMDPNTISGLLKLHLREFPLLSHKSNAALDKAMNGDKAIN